MDERIGRQLRALRRHRGWRQQDVAERASLSQAAVSLIERGAIERMPIARLRRVAAVLEAELQLVVRWRAGELDRLVDEEHAELAGGVAGWLGRRGWEVQPEVTFSVYGERGSIDLLAWHPLRRQLLVIEVKSRLVSAEETIRRLDVKLRLAGRVAAERFDWKAAGVSALLVLPDETTARRRVVRHGAILERVFPLRGADVRTWIGAPDGPIRGLIFISSPTRRPVRPAVRRVRLRSPESTAGRSRP